MSYSLCSVCGTHLRGDDSACPNCDRSPRGSRSALLAAALGVTLAAGASACDSVTVAPPQAVYGAPPMVDEAEPEGSAEAPESRPTEGSGESSAPREPMPPDMAIYGAPPPIETNGSGDKPEDELGDPPKL